MSVNPRVSLRQPITDAEDRTTTYTYDAIGRLTQAGNQTFTYDKADNNLNDNAAYDILNKSIGVRQV